MSWWELVIRGLQWRWLASVLNTLSVALGVGLVCVVLLIQAEVHDRFNEPGRGYGLVVGAPGSSLQLVLNAVFQLDDSPGRIPLELWHELSEHRSAALVVPYAAGDSFRGFPVVATTGAFFDPRFPHPSGAQPADKLRAGRPLRSGMAAVAADVAADDHGEHADHETSHHEAPDVDGGAAAERVLPTDAGAGDGEHVESRPGVEEHEDHGHHGEAHGHDGAVREAVVGADVAREVRVQVGDRIELAHGLEEGAMAHEHEALWKVVGILEHTGTSLDRVVFINLDSFFEMEDHAKSEPGLTALLVFPHRGVHTAVLMGELRSRNDLQVAHVSTEVARLLALIGRVDSLFLLIAQLVVAVALLSIFTSTYLAMHARKGQLGVLRALGFPRRRVLMLVVTESALLSSVGAALGFVGAHLLLWMAASLLEPVAGIRPSADRVLWSEGIVVVLVAAAGALAGWLPGLQAYRADVAASLRYVD